MEKKMCKKSSIITSHHVVFKSYNLLCIASYIILFMYTFSCVSAIKTATGKPLSAQQEKTVNCDDQMLGNKPKEDKPPLFKLYGEIPKGKALVYIYRIFKEPKWVPSFSLSFKSPEFMRGLQIEESLDSILFPISGNGDSYQEIDFLELTKLGPNSYLPYVVEPGTLIFGIHYESEHSDS